MIENPKAIHPDTLKALQHRLETESTFGKPPIPSEAIKVGFDSDDHETRLKSARDICFAPIEDIPRLMYLAISNDDQTVQLEALETYYNSPICLNTILFTEKERQALYDQYESIRPKDSTNPTRLNLDPCDGWSLLCQKF